MIWGFVGGVIGLALIAIWVITISDIIKARLGRGPTAGWLVIVLLLPFLGSVLYWALRKPREGEVQHQYDNELALRESARHRPFDSTSI